MSSIYDFPKAPAPYPEINPWYDLSSLIVNGWESHSSWFPFRAKVEGNEVHFYLRTRRGTSETVIEGLPEEFGSGGDAVFNAYAGFAGDVAFVLNGALGTGRVITATGDKNKLSGGALTNLVVESSFLRAS